MWKNLKGLFVVEEPGADREKTPSRLPPKSKNPAPAAAPASTPPVDTPLRAPVSADGQVNDKFVKVLLEAMEAANLPGFDYLEYKKALQNLEKMNFADSVRFQTAYAGAQSMGVTPAQLIDSAQHYLATLAGEQKKFETALDNQKQQQIGQKQQQLDNLDKEVAAQEEKIRQLQQQIVDKKARQLKLRATLDQSTGKLAATEADFHKTYAVITGQIAEDLERMKEYLK